MRALVRLGLLVAIIVAGCVSAKAAAEKSRPACTPAAHLQCGRLVVDSGDDPQKRQHADAFCRSVRAACTRAPEAASLPLNHPPEERPAALPASPAPVEVAPHSQRLFVRADPLDNPYPGLTQSPTAGQALGASFGYTANNFVQSKSGNAVTVSSSQSINISGLATYLLTEPQRTGHVAWIPAFWVSATGNWDNPTKAFGDTSALKFGPKVEFQLYPSEAGGTLNYFDIAPFYQTDFYGKARAGGLTVSWTPVNANYFLGESRPGYGPRIVDGFWVLRFEATNLSVSDPGQTNLVKQDYQWLGGAARGYILLFPTIGGGSWGPYLNDRFAFIGTVQSYWDARSGVTATLYSAALQYKLNCNTKDPTTSCEAGVATVTLQYDSGMDKDTLQEKKLLQLKLNYAL